MPKFNVYDEKTAEELRALLNVDPLALAEKLTEKDYKTDESTLNLGIGLHMRHVEVKKRALSESNDTYFSSTYDYARTVYQLLGFKNILTLHDPNGSDVYEVWWCDGVLLASESYCWGAETNERTVNSAKIYFNFKNEDQKYHGNWSGHYNKEAYDREERIFIGDIDVRDGLALTLSEMSRAGSFVSPWIEDPTHGFLGPRWSQKAALDAQDYDARMLVYRTVHAEVVALLPDDVQQAINPS